MKNFYKNLEKPIMALAPMSEVTDEPFRRMLLKCGRPDVFWTEFVSTDGLFSPGREKLLKDLKFIKSEHPIVAQVFGTKPELFEKAARLIKKLGFDGIDINMGCPNKDVEKRGAGAALIKNPKLARQIIRATKKGAGKMPVSVKTRIGYRMEEVNKWIPNLLKENLAVLTVHFRTRGEASKGSAHWELAEKIVKLRDRLSPETLIFGNGDVKTLKEARQLAKKTGLDGIMVGRGVLANPWFFSENTSVRASVPIGPAPPQRLAAVMEHAKLFEKLNKHKVDKKGQLKNFASVKKFFKAYVSGFDGAKDLRLKLFQCKSRKEVEKAVKDWKSAQ
jgi:nifR3 family TIM-barrel protein